MIPSAELSGFETNGSNIFLISLSRPCIHCSIFCHHPPSDPSSRSSIGGNIESALKSGRGAQNRENFFFAVCGGFTPPRPARDSVFFSGLFRFSRNSPPLFSHSQPPT